MTRHARKMDWVARTVQRTSKDNENGWPRVSKALWTRVEVAWYAKNLGFAI